MADSTRSSSADITDQTYVFPVARRLPIALATCSDWEVMCVRRLG